MCGINGILSIDIGTKKKLNDSLTKMNDLIIHRGPDDEGEFIEKNKKFELAMGMRRLSIIDLNLGRQPISNNDNSIVIVFNGEIYNYKKLRNELIEEGIVFETSSDTEVILKLYENHGVKSFSRLDGMYAFSIYDKKLKKVFIARDFFGEKPLYFLKKNKEIYWSSELKSIIKVLSEKPKISLEALSIYFQLTYIPAPYSIYEGIYKLEPNNYLEIDCVTLNVVKNNIGNSFINKYEGINFNEAKKVAHDMVIRSVKSRSISDVPIGAFLSGGVDSSIVSLALAQKSNNPINTFSIGFEKKSFDETNKSRIVAKLIGSNHNEFIVNENAIQNEMESVILNFDEPFADSSAIPTYLVSKLTQKHVKVALTGDGGDEVFGGYNKYYMGKLNYKYTNFIPQKIHEAIRNSSLLNSKNDERGVKFKIQKFFKAVDYNSSFYRKIISLGFQSDELNKLIKKNYLINNKLLSTVKTEVANLKEFRNIDKRLSLEGDMLVKVDRTSMLSSIECRSPFLNKELWNFTNHLPDSFLMNGWKKKYLLKESFKKYFPKNFLNKSKQGFGVPVGDWLRTTLRDELIEYTEVNFLNKQGIFNNDYIRKITKDHLDGKVDNTFRVWTFYCFQKWYYNQMSHINRK